MPPSLRRLRTVLLATASAGLIAAAPPAPVPPAALGIGDPLFPTLGNPGYDVLSYDIGLTYGGRNTEPLDATTVIRARTTEPLDRINLDFARGEVRSVEVNGFTAGFTTEAEDLIVTPPARLPAGVPLRLTVRHTSDPGPSTDSGGWVRTRDGLAMANQADAAHRVFPCNDHPSDKAYVTFRITTPDALTAVANGLPAGVRHRGTTTTRTFRTEHPMATELAQVSIGTSAVLRREGPGGLPLRDVVPAADQAVLEPWLSRTPAQMEWMERQVGPYPFETYGLLVADTVTGFELETQTLSLFERRLFTEEAHPAWHVESVMVHELAHQWFGDSVSPASWSDLWLNEGHASWYEARYAEERGGPALERRMRDAYTRSDGWRAAGGPPARPLPPEPGQKLDLFRPVVYDGGALVLYALRQEIGAPAFDRLERAWTRRYRDASATTSDFVRLASQEAGRDLTAFLDGWLHGERTPAMPGHPEWRAAAPAPTPSPTG
ncbi:M1 family metallopeptidase [Streptomyces sp. AM 2-1-1]|uniref:M1 family metallopeptidase n=1 Tax=Streptomyces sp. AM 2-1-1 TaxID=3028709 RepID=UPI0023B95570|nr:M1 family metallopeptidase [Streptomyces sp. AM 2-1-1]WEH39322.1 M1 family metallopeptidase [Streptomyces sp. AM 2-1-1]